MLTLADLLHRIFVKCFCSFTILHTAGLVLQPIAVLGRSVFRISTGCRIHKLMFASWFDLITSAKCGTIRLPTAIPFHIIIKCVRKIAKKKDVVLSRISVCPQGTTRLLLDAFSWNFTFKEFWKICRDIQFSLKSNKNNFFFFAGRRL